MRGPPPSSRAPLELVVVAGDAIVIQPLPPAGAVTLGRAHGCDIRIDNTSVSRKHAILHLGPPLRLEDLGSANGTFVRDAQHPADPAGTHPLRRLSKETMEIAVGERINLGSTTLVVRRAATGQHPVAAADDRPILRDPAMLALYEQASRAGKGPITILLLGETGVGKEVLAQAIHRLSPRARGPFVGINCAALPPSLVEAELFGYEKGAFTGADHARPGLFESADGGTVFLDEVGDLPAGMQAKLLRVIEDRKVLRVGGRAARTIDVRFLAATNRDLEADAGRGEFRLDLFYRLSALSLVIPPLRQRVAEIVPLAERFVEKASRMLERGTAPGISAEVRGFLERHAWPGNVRELRNVMDRAVVLCSGDVLLAEDLPPGLTGAASRRAEGGGARGEAEAGRGGDAMDRLRGEMKAVERRRIEEALAQCAGNQTRAAELLGISRRTLVNRIAEFRLRRPKARAG